MRFRGYSIIGEGLGRGWRQQHMITWLITRIVRGTNLGFFLLLCSRVGRDMGQHLLWINMRGDNLDGGALQIEAR